MHVHVLSPDGEAKFWLEPAVELALSKGLTTTELTELKRIVEERQNEMLDVDLDLDRIVYPEKYPLIAK